MEMVTVVLISGILMTVLWLSLRSSISARDRNYSRADLSVEVSMLFENILQIGRLASSTNGTAPACVKIPGGLECLVDFNVPPTGVTTKVHFVYAPKEKTVVYEKFETAGWARARRYTDITAFEVCDDADMKRGNDGKIPCQISPIEEPATFGMNRVHSDLADASPAAKNRFFRFRIQGGVSDKQDLKQALTEVQGSFFVRYPTLPPYDRLVYTWGTLE